MPNQNVGTRFPNRDRRPRPIDRDPAGGAIDPSPLLADPKEVRQRLVAEAHRQSQEELRSALESLQSENASLRTLVGHFENNGAARYYKSQAANLAAQVTALESLCRKPWYSFRQIVAAIGAAAVLSAAGAAALCMYIGG